jgi:mRNA interferase RelE/StbE
MVPSGPPPPCQNIGASSDCYKIKLKNAGYRLVYQVDDSRVVVIVVAVGKRENLTVYRVAGTRVKE